MRAIVTALIAVLCTGGAPASRANEKRTVEFARAELPVSVDIHLASPVAKPRGGVVFAHGLMRSRATMEGFAKGMATRGLVAVVPDLPALADAKANSQALREVVAALRSGEFSAPVDRIVLVGFSMGGLASLLAADAPGVVGWVGLDPVDQRGPLGLEAARALRVPATLVRATSAPCNAYGNAAPWARAFPQPAGDTVLADATHCDFESPSDGWCHFFCGESDPTRAQRVRDALLAAVLARFEESAAR